MKRSAIRVSRLDSKYIPDYVSLHPGYNYIISSADLGQLTTAVFDVLYVGAKTAQGRLKSRMGLKARPAPIAAKVQPLMLDA